MGITTPHIFTGHVMHQRLIPRKHGFNYGIFYVVLPLSQLKDMPLAYNRFSGMSFFDKDHGPCDGQSLEVWVRNVLEVHAVDEIDEITLVTMPRIMGYVFNPVSFWLCQDQYGGLKAVLCEVHNTFGEKHTYICKPLTGHTLIDASQTLEAEKAFHVSPFLKREGHYQFKFDVTSKKFNVFIDYFNAQSGKQLITSLIGEFSLQTPKRLRQLFWQYPLVTFKAIWLIHWHALQLLIKRIAYVQKPVQKKQKTSSTSSSKGIMRKQDV